MYWPHQKTIILYCYNFVLFRASVWLIVVTWFNHKKLADSLFPKTEHYIPHYTKNRKVTDLGACLRCASFDVSMRFLWLNHVTTINQSGALNNTKLYRNVSPIGLTVSCKSPSHVRVCHDWGPPLGHALTQVPPLGHVLTQGINRWFCFFLKIKWRHCVKSFTDLESTHQGLSSEVLHDMIPSISKFDLGVHYFRPWR
jgi:hypothetical protein